MVKSDYDYMKLLERAYSMLPKKVFETKRFEIPRGDVIQFGNRTILRNFREICDVFNREPEHVMKFLLRELATAGQIEGMRAVFQGRFSESAINRLIRRYAELYVICPICHKPDTRIVKEGRFSFLKCEACGAQNPVKAL
ncbi:MAG: translation initiation factor IF-2 subunit beta [Candidatus Asgardarchaeia archaeon]